ncbi:MAG: hypothetical protein ACRDCC_11950 [Culicoidibacterales bacterium]
MLIKAIIRLNSGVVMPFSAVIGAHFRKKKVVFLEKGIFSEYQARKAKTKITRREKSKSRLEAKYSVLS